MKCSFCGDNIKELDKPSKTHLCISKDSIDGGIHVHGNLSAKANVKEMLVAAAEEAGIPLSQAPDLPAEIVFHNRQRIGDMLMFTCGVRDFKKAFPNVRVNVVATAQHIFDHNPHIDRSLVPTEKNTVKIGPGKLTNASNRIDWHMANAYRVSMEDALGVSIPQGESRADIYFTEEEYNAPRLFEKPYWIISTSGEKSWGCKMFPHYKWQLVVDQNPNLCFVQIGTLEDNVPRLVGPNVIDWIGKTQSKETGIRDLFKLFLNAEGSIGLVSFHMHLSGALYKPAIVIAGGREPVHFTRYPGHAYLNTEGMLPCAVKACWHCNIDACTNLVDRTPLYPHVPVYGDEKKVPKCVDIIDPEDVTREIQRYYRGGRLVEGVASPKPKLKNIVPAPPKIVVTEQKGCGLQQKEDEPTEAFGMKFGGGSLTGRDWNFIQAVIKKYNVRTVIEFGAGLSTLLLNDAVRNPGVQGWVKTYETNQGWIDKIKKVNPFADILFWDGKAIPMQEVPERYDMAFVDGPAGDINREASTQWGAWASDVVIVHDAGREWAKVYQDKYLKAFGFEGPFKGGHRCHLWVKPSKQPINALQDTNEKKSGPTAEIIRSGFLAGENQAAQPVLKPGQKSIKIVSTARGWGGCARSVTTIMRRLLSAGHKVEFIPFRNSVGSREFQEILKGDLKDVRVTLDYSTVNEKCDVFLMYADDYVWEFGKPAIAETFQEINAVRTIMMLNYRRGSVGLIPWTRGWDKYMFLNRTQESELAIVDPGVYGLTKVLPPCVELDVFFAVKPDYANMVRVVRHSSQGDTKFEAPEIVENQIAEVLGSRADIHFSMLPGPSLVPPMDRFTRVPRTADPKVIANFLATGNLFWYSLPPGYMDMGPRVILEAMAAGLPVIADNWGGAIDRVNDQTGWICSSKEEQVQIMKDVSCAELQIKGNLAKHFARENFAPEVWIRELLN